MSQYHRSSTAAAIARVSGREVINIIKQSFVLSLVFISLGAAFSTVRFGSIQAGQSWLSGERVLIEPQGEHRFFAVDSDRIILKFILTNLENAPIRILGSNQSCSCTAVEELPSEIPPKGSIEVVAHIATSNSRESVISGSLRIFTDLPRHPSIRLPYHLTLERSN